MRHTQSRLTENADQRLIRKEQEKIWYSQSRLYEISLQPTRNVLPLADVTNNSQISAITPMRNEIRETYVEPTQMSQNYTQSSDTFQFETYAYQVSQRMVTNISQNTDPLQIDPLQLEMTEMYAETRQVVINNNLDNDIEMETIQINNNQLQEPLQLGMSGNEEMQPSQ